MAVIMIVFISQTPSDILIRRAMEDADDDGEVVFLRVVPVTALVSQEEISVEKARAKEELAALRQRASKLSRERAGLMFSSIVREGPADEVIADISDSINADEILMSKTDADTPLAFSSGTLSSAVGRKTGLPIRVLS